MLSQSPPYISLGQPGYWTQEISQMKRNPLGVKHLPTKKMDILRQALLWQLDHFIPQEAVVDLLWGDREDGGPLDTQTIIGVMVYRLRQQGHVIEVWRDFGLRELSYDWVRLHG